MKKSIKIAILIFTSLLFLGACDHKLTDQKKNNQDNMSTSQLIKKAKTANKKVETVHFDMSLTINSFGKKKSQKMKANLDYGDQADEIERASGEITTRQDGLIVTKSSYSLEQVPISEMKKMLLGAIKI